MSKFKEIAITCPDCGKKGSAVVYELVNVTKNPELRAKIIDFSLFSWLCPHCGAKRNLEQPLLYVDKKLEFAVHFAPVYDKYLEEKLELPKGLSQKTLGRLRKVSEINNLVEKILIAEAGLDDRMMEFCKLALINYGLDFGGHEYMPDMLFFEKLVATTDGKELNFVWIDVAGEASIYSMRSEVHDNIMDDMAEALAQNIVPLTVIDLKWAMAQVQKYCKK
ncbi:MAG: CpXC domain-containing protein [Clostridia bacterium]